MSFDEVVNVCVEILSKWIDKCIELFPILTTYMYTMNLDAVIKLVYDKYREKIGYVIELKDDLSKIRRIVHGVVEEYHEIRPLDEVDTCKYNICLKLFEKYCNNYRKFVIEKINTCDNLSKVLTAIILRNSSKVIVVKGAVARYSVRLDKAISWTEGAISILKDLGYDINVKPEELLNKFDLRDVISEKLPFGYASYDIVLVPTCLEDIVEKFILEYSNAQALIKWLKI